MFEHVVVLMLENHSFDRMLGYLQGVGEQVEGVDPDNLRRNPDKFGVPVVQHVTETHAVLDDPGHDLGDVQQQIGPRGAPDGGMQGFVQNFAHAYPAKTDEWPEIMGYYPQGFLPALHTLAESFVVCDHWFSSVPGPTWPNRFFVHSGTSLGHVDMPEGLTSPGLHIYDQTTVYDLLHDAGKGFAIYYGDFPQSLVLLHNDEHYLDNYKKMPQFAIDVAAGRLPNFSFIEPTYFASNGQNDQHPPHDVLRGDALIGEVYGALRANPALFDRTLLVILYDEHGGFYDHVSPPGTVAPDGHTSGSFHFDRLGPRVPAVLVSPMLDPGVLTDTFDHTSLLRFLVDGWGLQRGQLGARAAQATDFGPLLQVRPTPRDLPELPVIQAAPPKAPQELNANQASLVAFSQYLESRIDDPAKKMSLMARAHEVFAGPAAQAKLAQDRLAAFFQDKRGTPG
ncbi:MAG: alkaline phosphatase family protein [Acidisphaera sp.]|nr:alkaline phosphatase family protein [Acidisphaera sp.]